MPNNATSDLPIQRIQRICRNYQMGIVTPERTMAMIIQIASTELLKSVVEQEDAWINSEQETTSVR